ncbi:hypothetical protein C8R48DRAFT_697039 [Suillus tomentosus]|nr:hypothetical protein C8R48DRAFT_697039 [Suillus tomentosus]
MARCASERINSESLTPVLTLGGHRDTVSAISYFPDGKRKSSVRQTIRPLVNGTVGYYRIEGWSMGCLRSLQVGTSTSGSSKSARLLRRGL